MPTNGWKMEDTDRNNCLSLLIILCVGLADNCTFIIFTTKYTDTLSKESSWSRLLSLPKVEETWFIAPLIKLENNRLEQKRTSQAGDSPQVINDTSSSQAQGPSWLGYHFYCPVSYCASKVLCLKKKPAACSLRVWYLSSHLLFPQWTKM